MIPRLIEEKLYKSLISRSKVHLLLGARQVGKTTLLTFIKNKLTAKKERVIFLNCDIEEDRESIDTTSLTILAQLTRGYDYILIDEVQRLDNPGLTLKIIHDNLPKIRILSSGSSSFDIKNRLSETLTGRYIDFILYPLSVEEIEKDKKKLEYLLPNLLTYGSYPDIYLQGAQEEKKLYLRKIIESYLFKDILSYQKVRNPQAIMDLTKALSYQIGAEVNENELSNRLKIDRKTVVSYLDILEKAFVVIRLSPYSKNPRREIGKNYKLYFTDLGIRNTIIGDFNAPHLRPDIGSIWENFLILERKKKRANNQEFKESYFWRSYGGAEIDLLEKDGTEMNAYEIKWGKGGLSRGTKSFTDEYKIPVKLINQSNFLEFV